ncbi:MKI67 FHA domain-interacting nucleolar phosphoprotein, partial [Orchesella cincta]
MTDVGSEDIALAKSKQTALTKAVKRVKKELQMTIRHQKVNGGLSCSRTFHMGFYEKEIKSYFTQFGKVLRVRVGRSQKTGKSRGYAFVEFEFEEVAKIAAEAMNNYLMFERLIKCEVLSSDVNAKNISEDNYPKLLARKKEKAKRDLELTEEEGQDVLQQRLQKVEEQNKRLAKLGIPYEFKVGKTVVGEKAAAKAERKTKKVEEKVEEEDDESVSIDDDDNMEQGDSDDDSEDNDSVLEYVASMFPTPVKSKLQSPKIAEAETKKTPLKNLKFSPKMLRSRKSQGVPTVETKNTPGKKARTSDLPKISPKQLRSRKSQGQTLQAATPAEIKSTPTPRKKDNVSDLPKISPKHLRNRKSQGPNVQTPVAETNKTPGKKTKASELPKISPKLLRSRKSEAVLTPLKEKTPSKAKKGGRKSVL